MKNYIGKYSENKHNEISNPKQWLKNNVYILTKK